MTMKSIMCDCLPLQVEESGIISDKDAIGFGEFAGFTTEQLKYIVGAINNHDALVALAELAASILHPCDHNSLTIKTEAVRVLAKIKAES